jgi:L-threonylcarbamoyladenylate synthase
MSIMIKENFIIQKLKKNKVVAIPTDTIFGFSCLPSVENFHKLANLKNRNPNKGFIILTSDLKYLSAFITQKHLDLLQKEYKKTHKPTTFIVPSFHKLATKNTIAIRLTSDNLIDKICNKLNSAIISTSCNLAGKNNIKTILKLRLFFGKIDFITPKNSDEKSSTIIDLMSGKILRK